MIAQTEDFNVFNEKNELAEDIMEIDFIENNPEIGLKKKVIVSDISKYLNGK